MQLDQPGPSAVERSTAAEVPPWSIAHWAHCYHLTGQGSHGTHENTPPPHSACEVWNTHKMHTNYTQTMHKIHTKYAKNTPKYAKNAHKIHTKAQNDILIWWRWWLFPRVQGFGGKARQIIPSCTFLVLSEDHLARTSSTL